MLNRLIKFSEKYHILHESQHGFREKHSTSTAAVEVINLITKALDSKEFALAIFYDVSKAFDSLNHNILICKLKYYGIRETALNWFISYLKNRFHYTFSNNISSSHTLLTCGVPQDSILGPTLYLLYVNDIFNVKSSGSVKLCADNTTILITAKSVYELNVIANNVLNDYVMWFSNNLLALNQKKSHFIVFSHHSVANNILPNLHSNGCTITRVNQIKFLGIIIDENLC